MVKLNINLPKDFFKEEYLEKYDFTVTRHIKEIWAVELDIAYQISKICKKHNLRLFADGGTQLGCVRHNNSFVPWDDDIDFAMLRKEYDIFCKVAKKELKYPYFFQDNTTDNIKFHHVKIRRSDTSAIPGNLVTNKYNNDFGIFVDIFPLDVVPENKIARETFRRKIKMLDIYSLSEDGKIFKKQYDVARLKYNNSDSSRLANLSFPRDIHIFKDKYQYEQATPVKFCKLIDIYLPKDSDKTLQTQYGDWRVPRKGLSKHSGTIYDTNISYKNFNKVDTNRNSQYKGYYGEYYDIQSYYY